MALSALTHLDSDNKLKNLTRGAAAGAAWVFSGNVVTLGLRVLFLALLARMLTPADFGLAAMGTSFSAFSNLFSDAGISNTLVQRKELEPRHISTAFGYSLLLGLIFMIATVALSGVAESFFAMPGLGAVLCVMAVSFFFQALCVVPRALLKRAMRFRALTVSEFVAFNIGYGATACVLALLHFGVWALVLGITVSNGVGALSYFVCMPHKLSVRFERAAFKDLVGTSSGFSVAAVANLIALQADNLIVGHFLGARSLGYYSRAYQLMTIPATALGQVVSYVFFPMLSRIQDDGARLQRAFLRGTAISALVGLPASVLIPIYAPEIVAILFGQKWLSITPVLAILGLGTYFRLGYKIPGAIQQATGYVGTNAATQCIYAVCVVGGASFAVRYNLNLVAVAVLSSISLTFLLANYLTIRALRVPWRNLAAAFALPAAVSIILGSANYALVGAIRPIGNVWLTAGLGLLLSAMMFLPLLVTQRGRALLLNA
jgi:O-antigen/teichoic acid export membrane protein